MLVKRLLAFRLPMMVLRRRLIARKLIRVSVVHQEHFERGVQPLVIFHDGNAHGSIIRCNDDKLMNEGEIVWVAATASGDKGTASATIPAMPATSATAIACMIFTMPVQKIVLPAP